MAQYNCTLPSIYIQISLQRFGNTLYFKKIQGTCSEILLITGENSFHPKEPNFCNYEETEELINQLFTVYF